jgi:hypothetical protein
MADGAPGLETGDKPDTDSHSHNPAADAKDTVTGAADAAVEDAESGHEHATDTGHCETCHATAGMVSEILDTLKSASDTAASVTPEEPASDKTPHGVPWTHWGHRR